MSRLWDKGEALDPVVARFTAGRDPELDLELVRHDALASCAHAAMLHEIGVLSAQELAGLRRELAAVVREVEAGDFEISRADEDGHTALENRLTARLGAAGRKIHTGRSRNDQVIAALRLWGREGVLAAAEARLDVAERLLELAAEHREVSMPGFTHTRQAMPTTLGHLFAAHAELLLDAAPWLRTAFDHLDRSPLGSASGYGVPLPLDREQVRRLLGFARLQGNTLAVQNDRGRSEHLVLTALAVPVSDLGRLAHDLILLSADETGWLTLAPGITTGSSIMPQKRNPDVLELLRSTAARLRCRVAEVAAVYAPLPSGYHRDLQHTKEPFLTGVSAAVDALRVGRVALDGLRVHPERCRAAVLPATAATDEVYRRVAAGTPFRDAYREVAADPGGAVAAAPDGLAPADAWRRRTHAGAPGALGLAAAAARLEEERQEWAEVEERVAAAWDLLAG